MAYQSKLSLKRLSETDHELSRKVAIKVYTDTTFQNKLLKKIMKKPRNKSFGSPSKIFKNVSWPINVCLKYFMDPKNTHLNPSFILSILALYRK